MNRFQVSSVEITGDSGQSNGAGGGSTLTSNGQQQQPPHSRSGRPGNGSVVAGSGELQLSAYNLVSNEAGPSSAGAGPSTMPASTSSAGAGAAAGNNDAASSGSGLQRKFSIQQLTREALPRLDNYRRSIRALKRPSLGLLHGEALEQIQEAYKEPEEQAAHSGLKLGWIQGVLIPCLLNIWGVMLFLRISWVVAQAGIVESLLIIGISATVCVITTLSLSAICTNGEVKGGGIYYIISRSLGPEFGASVGIVFAFANAVAASMNTIGFCDSMNDLLKSYDVRIVDGGINDTRIVGTIALAIMIVICAIGMEWESKAQNFLVAIIVAAIFNFILGAAIGPMGNEEKISKGFEGLSAAVYAENWRSDYKFSENVHQSFFSVFAIFFPSVTGIQAGANISGDLKDPASAIPKGTLLSLLISMISYVLFVLFSGGAAFREASGNIGDLVNGSMIGVVPSCVADNSCEFGLHYSYTIMQLMSLWGPLIYAGCFAATLSTALTNLLSVPRLIQALGKDRIYPGLIYFAKGYGKHGEPYRGYVLTFFVSLMFLLIGQLNLIAPLISTFYLASYALINFCTFHAAFVKPLGWRPTFRYYNVWLSLAGFALCVTIMFLIDWISSLITFIVIFALYLIVVYRKPDVNWGSSTQAQTYKTALTAALRLQSIGDHVKNYRPQVLVLAGSPHMRPPLVDLANLITKNNSLMVVGDVITKEISYKSRQFTLKEGHSWLEARKIRAFYDIVQSADFETGVGALLQTSGVGKLSPNITLMGYKKDWQTCKPRELTSYFNVMHKSFSFRMAVAILRLPDGLDYSHLNIEVHNAAFSMLDESLTRNSSSSNFGLSTSSAQATGDLKAASQLMHADSNLNLAGMTSTHSTITTSPQLPAAALQKRVVNQLKKDAIVYSTQGGSCVPKETLDAIGLFHNKQNTGTIDVWWLYDDGGLTMLIPYIISMRSTWADCKIRVFALTNHKMELEVEERNMANLLSKLRIDYSSLTMLQGMSQKPSAESLQFHASLLEGFRETASASTSSSSTSSNGGGATAAAGPSEECFVPDTELCTLEEKTNRQLRLRELLLEHSTGASLVVMSLPMPRQGAVSAPLYMSWLEVLTRDMPPFLLIRGNQMPVLTFYS